MTNCTKCNKKIGRKVAYLETKPYCNHCYNVAFYFYKKKKRAELNKTRNTSNNKRFGNRQFLYRRSAGRPKTKTT